MDLMSRLIAMPPFSMPQHQKDGVMLEGLRELCLYHLDHCEEYRRLGKVFDWNPAEARCAEDLPWLPVGIFKTHRLLSVSEHEVYTEVVSSGTSGRRPSRVALDRGTADLQARALSSIMTGVLGKQRRPMIVIDSESVLHDPKSFSARGAGVLGMMRFGRRPFFALDHQMQLREKELSGFLKEHAGESLLIFGFTFMVWEFFLQAVRRLGPDLSSSILIHSGGWKKLQARAVDNADFKAALSSAAGIRRIYNFYGMAEQVGSVFLEGEDGLLYPPVFADVVIRDPISWRPLPPGKEGVLQVLSLIPRSYPGHSLMTEDIGVIESIDSPAAGRLGKGFRIIGRAPESEIRGCSDTFSPPSGRMSDE